MPSPCSLIIVNYHSAPLAIDAARSARAATRNPLQVVIIDNSVDDREAEALKHHADVFIAAETNLGYGTAINRARRHCDGDVVLAANPDVRFGPGSIDLLLDADADVAGPALYWDDAFAWILPPSDLHTAFDAFDAAFASRSALWRRRRDRRRIKNRMQFWSLRTSTPVAVISGAVMAIRSAAFDRLGGFDERFRLYFEEVDFLRRLGRGIVYVPSARCRHIYNQSAGISPAAAAEYARSETAYFAKWSPISRLAKRFERPHSMPPAIPFDDSGLELDDTGVLIEASPLPSFETAAGYFPTSRHVSIPREIWESYRGDTLYLRAVDLDSRAIVGMWAKTRIPS